MNYQENSGVNAMERIAALRNIHGLIVIDIGNTGVRRIITESSKKIDEFQFAYDPIFPGDVR